MQVIFCKLPPDTTLAELEAFAESGVKSYFALFKKSPIISCDFLDIQDEDAQRREVHGLVNFASDEDGQRAIKALNGKTLHGRPIRVKEFLSRSPGDKRVNMENRGLNRPEDRRRKNLEVRKRSEPEKVKPMAAKDSAWVD